MKTGWLQCEIASGLFPQERAVSFHTAKGERVELFCPNEFTRENSIQVEILDEQQSLCLVRLPADPLNAPRVVLVERDQVRSPLAA